MMPAVRAISDATANPQYLVDIEPVDGRRTGAEVRSDEIANSAAGMGDTTLPIGSLAVDRTDRWPQFTSQAFVT